MDTFWLGELARESLGNFEATSEIDLDLSRRARLARRDGDEGWTLFTMLAWKINRFVRRFGHWNLAPWELDDVVQQSYLVYLDTLQLWTPRYIGYQPAGYLYYFLAVFPHWMENAVREWNRVRSSTVPLWDADDTRTLDAEDRAVIEDFCGLLDDQEAELLRLRVASGASVPHIAASLGIARSTAYRRWHRIVEVGQEYLRKAG